MTNHFVVVCVYTESSYTRDKFLVCHVLIYCVHLVIQQIARKVTPLPQVFGNLVNATALKWH